MTERDLIRQVMEKSIIRTVDIEILRRWAKARYEEARRGMEGSDESYSLGQSDAFYSMLSFLDSLEVTNV